jgi:hypothetical protein
VGVLIVASFVACGAEIDRSGSRGAQDKTGGIMTPPPGEGQCENFSLTFGSVTLPAAVKGTTYDIRLHDYAQDGWYGDEYSPESLPPGLELTTHAPASDPVLRGVPTEAGSFRFVIRAVHGLDGNGCSTMPDPHPFVLDVAEADGGADAADAASD